jgi:transposase
MMIIGCDYHPGFQQIAFVDSETGEWNERRLGHREEAEEFYRDLEARGVKVVRRDGSERACPLVRAAARRTAF